MTAMEPAAGAAEGRPREARRTTILAIDSATTRIVIAVG